jgi:hypothetical protein
MEMRCSREQGERAMRFHHVKVAGVRRFGNYYIKPFSSVAWKCEERDGIVLDLESGNFFVLNEVASRFWERADGSRTISYIINALSDEFEEDPAIIESDITKLVETLMANNLVELSILPMIWSDEKI